MKQAGTQALHSENAEMLMKATQRAAKQLTKITPWQREDLEGKLIIWALEDTKSIPRYLRTAKTNPDGAYMATVGTLLNIGREHLREEKHENIPTRDLADRHDEGDAFASQNVTFYERQDIIKLLPLTELEDADIPSPLRELVSIFRSELYSLTPRQQLVLRRWSRGEKLAVIARSINVTRQTAWDRKEQAIKVLESRIAPSSIGRLRRHTVSTSP